MGLFDTVHATGHPVIPNGRYQTNDLNCDLDHYELREDGTLRRTGTLNQHQENTMRQITDHIINTCNDKLAITVTDEPGAGGANHAYVIQGFDTKGNPSLPIATGPDPSRIPAQIDPRFATVVLFQNGPINEKGVNGITQEVLLAIVADRLRSFQAGPFACRENALALTKIEEAMHWLQQRTIARMRRGVEGTHTV
jgi:hypothetical protein